MSRATKLLTPIFFLFVFASCSDGSGGQDVEKPIDIQPSAEHTERAKKAVSVLLKDRR